MSSIQTLQGPATVLLQEAPGARALLLLGHGAGGSVSAPDLQVTTRAALGEQVSVGLVEQPYRVAGRRTPPAAAKLDEAWLAVVDALSPSLPLIVGGRSSGARVACRTAARVGAVGVVCLAFPLQPPPRTSGSLAPDRLHELDAVPVPTLVVQGRNDQFGVPPPAARRQVVVLDGDHSLRKDLTGIGNAVRDWLRSLSL